MKILSFIIPAYNSARFLDKCVSSMIHEDIMDKLEIIIVNDGSTDETVNIAEALCRQYPDVLRLITQENKGHGGALNAGCLAASGKYLKVIDADDWVENQNLPEFIRMLGECESDVVLSHYHTIDISNGAVKKWRTYPPAFQKGYTFAEIMCQWKNFDRCLTFHGITYKTDFYHKHGIQLSEHVFYEDHEFATFPCCYAREITPMDIFIYDYRIGDIQQSVSDANQLKRIGHTRTVLRRLQKEYLELDPALVASARDYVCMKTQGLLLSYLTTSLLVNRNKREGRKAAEEMMEEVRSNMPKAWEWAYKQYRILRILNHVGVSKKQFEKVLRSRLYARIRNNRDFE